MKTAIFTVVEKLPELSGYQSLKSGLTWNGKPCIMIRTFAAVEVELDMLCHATADELDMLIDARLIDEGSYKRSK